MQTHPVGKAELRTSIVAARRAVPAAVRLAEARQLRVHLLDTVRPGTTLCAYVPVGSEPGSVELLDALLAVGIRVLLPVAREIAGAPQPLGWGEYVAGDLVAAPFGLREPAGAVLPPDALASAELVLVPALAVDRCGTRLGRGAGYYDRSLGLAAPTATLAAVVRDDELLEHVPGEPHDVAMTHALTPGGGFVPLRFVEHR